MNDDVNQSICMVNHGACSCISLRTLSRVYVRVRAFFFISVQISIHVLFAWYILLLKCYVYMLNRVALALLVLSTVPYLMLLLYDGL